MPANDPMTPQQRKAIFAELKRIGIDTADADERRRILGVSSFKDLTRADAARFLDRIKQPPGRSIASAPSAAGLQWSDSASDRQRRYIASLLSQIFATPEAAADWLYRHHRISDVMADDFTRKHASKIITTLRAWLKKNKAAAGKDARGQTAKEVAPS